jgi:hypothetical protein
MKRIGLNNVLDLLDLRRSYPRPHRPRTLATHKPAVL